MSRSLLALVIGAFFLLAAFARLAGQAERAGEAGQAKQAGQARQAGPQFPANYPPDEIRNDFGRIVSLDLIAAPFPHRARKDGYSHEGEFFPRDGHYDDSKVSVFIPKGFEPSGSVDLVFFFHGWYSSVPEAARDFALFRQFSASGAKALLVLPEMARDAPDSFGGKLEDEEGFTAFVRELLERLHSESHTPPLSAGRITLVGHSGAYHVISRILGQGGMASKVETVCLFDALYEDLQIFADWILGGNGRFVSISAGGGDPADNARELAASLRQKGVAVETASDDPSEDARVLGHRVVFLSSPYDHGALISQADEFRRVLAAGVSPQ